MLWRGSALRQSAFFVSSSQRIGTTITVSNQRLAGDDARRIVRVGDVPWVRRKPETFNVFPTSVRFLEQRIAKCGHNTDSTLKYGMVFQLE